MSMDTATGETSAQEVQQVMANYDADLLDLAVQTPTGPALIQTTQHHLIWNDDASMWMEAGGLPPGAALQTASPSAAVALSRVVRVGPAVMWDLSVATNQNFFFFFFYTEDLVHNCPPNPGTPMTKATSPVWQEAQSAGGATRTNGETGRKMEYYQWDYTHRDIEVYNSRGVHKGSMDPVTGETTKPAEPGRVLER